jgi:hypothetical protein
MIKCSSFLQVSDRFPENMTIYNSVKYFGRMSGTFYFLPLFLFAQNSTPVVCRYLETLNNNINGTQFSHKQGK